jgi:hypothetical protein
MKATILTTAASLIRPFLCSGQRSMTQQTLWLKRAV